MNVLLVSQCDKRALTETRRILDQFAERRGDRTWQTPITQDGLNTLRKLLRKTARKNTAVACHWIRGLNHSELLWIVGDRRRFNEYGAVPTNTTRRNILRTADENDWHNGETIRLLVDLAGLLHDLGKSIEAFQLRLKAKAEGRNLIRHEWVSLRLFEAFVGTDDDPKWLARLSSPTSDDDERWLKHLRRDGLDGNFDSPFRTLENAPFAQAIGWLVVTHHRLPELPPHEIFQTTALRGLLSRLQPAWNERAFSDFDPKALKPYWTFPDGLPVTTDAWRRRAGRIASRLSRLLASGPIGSPMGNPFVMHLARLALMLADHHYSSLEGSHPERLKMVTDTTLLANTIRKTGQPNQPLDEHLLGVAQHGSQIARFLPRMSEFLPRLGRHKRLQRRSKEERYRWQDRSADLASSIRNNASQNGAFVVNMASTGCGKTLGNARIMYALADPALGMRCAFALGLRTLTLQTGHVFRDTLELDDEELAILVGGSASRELFEYREQEASRSGSESTQNLLDEDSHVTYEGAIDQHPLLQKAVLDPSVRKMLLAPVLVCTIDHLTPATESQRGGRQIAPMLRLLSGDLVLDEPDDFDLSDLPALCRLVHWAGLLGSNVLLSSATLPPALVQGLFEAYRDGRQHYRHNCSATPGSSLAPPSISCLWTDEFHQQVQSCTTSEAFQQAHGAFAERRHQKLASLATQSRRLADLVEMPKDLPVGTNDLSALANRFAPSVICNAAELHRIHHSIDKASSKRVSFGLIRLANIEPLYQLAQQLILQSWPDGFKVHLCVYHSQHPLLIRSLIEHELDTALQRHDPDAVFRHPTVRQRLDESEEADHLFIVLGSPVTEVGRDHDYDWALVEPSSMRSLIQLAGRVRRHRTSNIKSANIRIFRHNLRHIRQPGKAAFCRPGFETDDGDYRLATHDLAALLRPEHLPVIDARPRIRTTTTNAFRPKENLADLEHAQMRAMMLPLEKATASKSSSRRARALLPAAQPVLNAATWWHQAPEDALLSAVIPQQQPFRDDSSQRQVTVVLMPDESGETVRLQQAMRDPGNKRKTLYAEVDRLCERLPLQTGPGQQVQAWGSSDYMTALRELADALDLSLTRCAERFGVVAVPESTNGWVYHPALGFTKRG